MLSTPVVQRPFLPFLSRSGRRRRRPRERNTRTFPDQSKEVDAPPANRPRGLTRAATVWEEYMNLRFSLASAVAVALVFGATSTASAQADTTRRTPTSQKRVRVTKESNGEVAIRRDSAFIRDSIARADSLARLERSRQDSMARADSLGRIEQMRRDSIRRDSTARADSAARAKPVDTTTTRDTI